LKAFDFTLLFKVINYTKAYKFLFISTIIISFFFAFLSIIRPLLIQYAFDNYILIFDLESLSKIIFLILILLVFEAFLQFLFVYRSNLLAHKIINNIRNELFEKMLYFKVNYFDSTPTGQIITRVVSDMESISAIFSQGLLVVFGDLFKLFLIITCMLLVDWKLAFVSLLFLPFLILSTIIFQKYMRDAFVSVRKYISKINSFLYEHIIGMSIVQIFGKENHEFQSFKKLNVLHRDAHIKTILYFSIFLPIVDVFSAIAMGLLVWYGAINLVSNGEVTIGEMIAFILFINMLFRPLRGIADRFNVLQMGLVAASRVFQLLEKKIDSELIQNSNEYIKWSNTNIHFKNVTFSYKENEIVLDNINFSINSNQTLAIVGSTGSGKTTIINLLMKWYDLIDGDIYVNNTNLSDLKTHELRKNIGIVLQNNFFLSDTLLNNIKFFNNISDEEVFNAVDKMGLKSFIEKFPEKYNYHIGERGAGLSEGEKQLVSFLRSYLLNPSCLVLDEATSSLDPFTENLIQTGIKNLTEERTSIIIAHRLSTVRYADNIIVLEKGKIIESGTHDQLIALKGEYANYFSQQFIHH
tara:strand:- start:8831 stop:10573 length:1743 start_codon:yes stop_codon:yes gene_type:complete